MQSTFSPTKSKLISMKTNLSQFDFMFFNLLRRVVFVFICSLFLLCSSLFRWTLTIERYLLAMEYRIVPCTHIAHSNIYRGKEPNRRNYRVILNSISFWKSSERKNTQSKRINWNECFKYNRLRWKGFSIFCRKLSKNVINYSW